jgi:beta-glucanase (GH16 family)
MNLWQKIVKSGKMNNRYRSFQIMLFPVLLAVSSSLLNAQEFQLVWAEEFEGEPVDRTVWQFESGPSNDNVQYYTDRTENATVADGKLKITALKESYQGYEYTSAHLRTEKAFYWRYGRMEASIRLPGTPGFVPAFWMLPEEFRYGWWPNSGEIDIMEHPTNEVNMIYGTVHTGQYNLFMGPLPPQGGTLKVEDAESAFHLYAVEWTPEKIDFFVDDQKYYTFSNDGGSTATWPFDRPFYLILNLAVGGGWVGSPGETTVFPAVMEVDYVRVYQAPENMGIRGPASVTYGTLNTSYSMDELAGASYQWSVPGGATITSGQNTARITVDWGIFSGDVKVTVTAGSDSYRETLPVRVTSNILRNAGFETGVKYWRNAAGYPLKAEFTLENEEYYSGAHSVRTGVTDGSGNPWEVQLSQPGISLVKGMEYHAGLAARKGTSGGQISASVIDLSDFSLAGQSTINPGEDWTEYEFDFTPSKNMNAAFNVDMGGQTGTYYLDDFILTTEELQAMNLVNNPDFFNGEEGWNLTTLSSGVADGSVSGGEYAVQISNGGSYAWDVHLGQSGLPVESGYEYTVSFDARANTPRQVTFLVGMDEDPWTVYSDQEPVEVGTERKTYSFTFPMSAPTDLQARLGFDIGGDTAGLYFDNILLRKGDPVSNVSVLPLSLPSLSGLLVYPQPAGGKVSFIFDLGEKSIVSIQILSPDGRELGSVDGGYMGEGRHTLTYDTGLLPPGTYLYSFRSGERFLNGKLIVAR